MKVLIMTDMEGCAGIINAQDYIYTNSRYYEQACELATLEVSAAAQGALDAGATEVVVVDGHGPSAMKRGLLHPMARLIAGRPWPREFITFGCDGTFNACMIVGQHAMSGTDGGHLSHTMSFNVEEYLLNGAPIGELGLFALTAGYFGVPTVLVSGDEAAGEEAKALMPNVETAVVKYGMKRGSSHGLSAEENSRFNSAAMHLHPDEARARIHLHAWRALRRLPEIAPARVEGPYALVMRTRHTDDGKPAGEVTFKAGDYLDLLRNARGGTPAPAKKAAPAAQAKKPAASAPVVPTATAVPKAAKPAPKPVVKPASARTPAPKVAKVAAKPAPKSAKPLFKPAAKAAKSARRK